MPRKQLSPEQREKNRAASVQRAKAKWRAVALDIDTIKLLKARVDKLAKELGFRPSLSQGLLHLLKNEKI